MPLRLPYVVNHTSAAPFLRPTNRPMVKAEAETKKNSLQFPRTADETAIAATSPGGGTATGAESGNTATVIIQTLREENASLRVRLAAAVGDVGSMDVVGKGRGPNDEGFVTGVGRCGRGWGTNQSINFREFSW